MKEKRLSAKDRKIKLETSAEYREEIFELLLKHVRNGYSLDCFAELSEYLIDKFVKDYPDEFDKEALEEAQRAGKQGWEDIGRKQASGQCLGNSRSWYYNMSNRYGWSDRQRVEQKTDGTMQVNIVSYGDRNAPLDV